MRSRIDSSLLKICGKEIQWINYANKHLLQLPIWSYCKQSCDFYRHKVVAALQLNY